MGKQTNSNLHMSRAGKTDEFYTDITMIENELRHYREYFKDKVVFCNCDDPEMSNFWKCFQINFYMLGLKKLISTHFKRNGTSYKLEIVRQDDKIGQLSFMPEPIKKANRTLKKHRAEIINSFIFPYSNGPVEGTNNKIKAIKKTAYGFRNFDNFRLRILLAVKNSFLSLNYKNQLQKAAHSN